VFDLKTLKAKMEERKRELEEYERLHPKNTSKANESSDDEEQIKEGILPKILDGQFKDDSDIANVADIKLSENLGGFNSIIKEGGPTSRMKSHFVNKSCLFVLFIRLQLRFLRTRLGCRREKLVSLSQAWRMSFEIQQSAKHLLDHCEQHLL
jgi:hypothetical protein